MSARPGVLKGAHPTGRCRGSTTGTDRAGRRADTLYRLEVTADKARTGSKAPASAPSHPHVHPAPTVRVALLGCGNVGGALAEILLTRADDVAARTGIRLELVGIAVANPDKPRHRPSTGGSSAPMLRRWSPATTWTWWSS